MEALAIEAVLEFLDRNGFPRASAALRDDILSRAQSDLSRPDGEGGGGEEDTGELGREDDFSAIPALLPRVRTSGDRRGDGETDSNFTLRPIPSSSSSSSDEAFVSMGSSPTDLTNPYGLWPTTRQAESGEDDNDNDSNRQSEFGTARDYMEPSVFSDTVCWFNDTLGGSSWNQPFLTRTFSGGSGGAADSSAGGGFPTGRDADRWSENDESSDFLSDANASWVGTAGPKPGKGCRDCSDYFPAHCDLCSGTAVKELHSTESGLDRDEDQNDSIFTLAEEDKDADSAPHSNAMDGNYETGFRDTVHPDVFGQVRDQFYMSGQQQLPEKELHMLSINGNTGEEPGTKLRGEYDPSWRIENAKEDNIHDIFAVNSKTFRTQDDIDSHSISEEPSNVTNVNGTIDFKEYENIHENNDLEVSGEEKSNSPQVLDFPDEEYEVFELRVVHRKNRTGFEENKDMPIIMNTLIAGRYYVTEYLGSAAFSKVIQAHDLHTGVDVCLKIIKNDKDFFDQSLDEIKLLKFVNKHDPLDEHHMLRLYDYFYHQEHLFIVCELLKANLYEFQKYNLESGGEAYFTLPRIQSIALQCLEALEYLHSLGIIHCDLKPENILIKSYSRCEIKIIDLGSSCFHTDHLGFYVQSRSYRAPEVILGLPYGQKIDIWSLGCVLAELYSGDVLFANESLEVLLGRMMGILGPFDLEILEMGQETGKYFTKDYDLFCQHETGELEYIIPQRSSLASHLGDPDPAFLSFLQYLLHTNPNKRPSAAEALHHPWLSSQQW